MKWKWYEILGMIVVALLIFGAGYYYGALSITNEKSTTASVSQNSEGQSAIQSPQETQGTQLTQETQKTDRIITEGEYVVGKDIPSGEYKLFVNKDSNLHGAFEVKESSAPDGKIIGAGTFADQKYVTVKDGEYFELTNCYAVKANNQT